MGFVILGETTPVRADMVHNRINVISFVLIRSDPLL